MLHFRVFFSHPCVLFFFFNDTATTEIYTLSLHDALPTSAALTGPRSQPSLRRRQFPALATKRRPQRSEEHTSELQSRLHLVCRLLLEKKKKQRKELEQKKHKKEKKRR